MKTATFENTVNVLVNAYLNNTLQHGNCYACAVGNLVCTSMGFNMIGDVNTFRGITWDKYPGHYHMPNPNMWTVVFYTNDYGEQIMRPENYKNGAKEQIDSTGYTWQELARIEKAFELSKRGANDDEWMFNGLMAVVDVLADIHNVDLSVKESAKLMFVKP